MDRHVEGVVEMVLDATANCQAPVTRERLSGWHAALFPTGYSGLSKIKVGGWRDDTSGPVQVVLFPRLFHPLFPTRILATGRGFSRIMPSGGGFLEGERMREAGGASLW
ncbi:hypothetical protein [Ectothiorhodospira shaposhnikovii]|uniref:hypothetical protein n=1 Tax=Ectothiorhodospira shaposhnikovii TaxID=1054 RepID=UPI001EE93097|nr:hypothetical protein [Ectothiorhodospira shaposhnikovii]